MSLGTLALFVPFTYLPELAESAGVDPERAAYLVAAGGLSSSLGRVLSGWLNDQAWCCPLALTTIAVALAAIQPILLTWLVQKTTVMALAAIQPILLTWLVQKTPPWSWLPFNPYLSHG